MLTVSRTRDLIVAALPLLSWGTAAQNLNSCPGYRASNIVSTGSTLTADLTLNGPACNVYGTDLTDLKSAVEYQTGTVVINSSCKPFHTEI
jgi:alpha-glucosidase